MKLPTEMIAAIEIGGQKYEIDLAAPLDISIPLEFNGPQPNAYGVERATSEPCAAGALVGDTRRGGSCNFERYELIPHCSGTHTEGVGHLTHERISIRDCLRDTFIPAVLLSIEPEPARETNETYSIKLAPADPLITRQSLAAALDQIRNPKSEIRNPTALIVRTLPNDAGKPARAYLDEIPPFFSTAAIEWMREKRFRHLLVDLPSIDRLFDEGRLSNHRLFWNVGAGEFAVTEKSFRHHTITELIFVPDEIPDGEYLLNLQIPPFMTDAAPSRPVLFAIR
ncbi:MAG: cyclase family protein [Acidobacteria bacterium]|nr:cyclase family protein [Acidobacteriota bacterium]